MRIRCWPATRKSDDGRELLVGFSSSDPLLSTRRCCANSISQKRLDIGAVRVVAVISMGRRIRGKEEEKRKKSLLAKLARRVILFRHGRYFYGSIILSRVFFLHTAGRPADFIYTPESVCTMSSKIILPTLLLSLTF